MAAPHFQARRFDFTIRRRSAFSIAFGPFYDTATGETPFNFLADNAAQSADWIGIMEIRTGTGERITGFHSAPPSGAADWPGTVTFTDTGYVLLELSSAATASLSPLTGYGQPGGSLAHADLVLIDPADGESYIDFIGTGSINQEVTIGG